ncbi:NAD(P)-dependent oxidoreductase [Streptomyces sp. NPDC093249]|uniref:NAD(P)-dependent oxidoreductase n=1 Tax=unclassified Streptomyces TaxID=2593676 RepID=UPI00344BF0AF
MRLLLFGVTGGTGAQLLSQALAAGHRVTAVARDPARVRTGDPKGGAPVGGPGAGPPGGYGSPEARLTVLRGDALAPEGWREAVAGHDAVVSCLGSTDRRHPTTVYSQGTRHIVEAMRASGVRRLLCLSSAGLDVTPDLPLPQRLVTRHVIQRLYRHGYADMTRMEGLLSSAVAEETLWTVVRPPMLTDGPPTGRYRTVVGGHLERPKSLSRADLAHCLLGLVEDPRTHRTVVEAAY